MGTSPLEYPLYDPSCYFPPLLYHTQVYDHLQRAPLFFGVLKKHCQPRHFHYRRRTGQGRKRPGLRRKEGPHKERLSIGISFPPASDGKPVRSSCNIRQQRSHRDSHHPTRRCPPHRDTSFAINIIAANLPPACTAEVVPTAVSLVWGRWEQHPLPMGWPVAGWWGGWWWEVYSSRGCFPTCCGDTTQQRVATPRGIPDSPSPPHSQG